MLARPEPRLMCRIALVAIALVACLPAAATTILQQQDLGALVDESRRAVLATIVDLEYRYDEHELHSTYLTLRVDEALYGEALPAKGGRFTIKLYGAPDPLEDGKRVFIEGTPLYSVGEQYLLLLKDDSKWGFTNVAGLFQGAFPVTLDAEGRRKAKVVSSLNVTEEPDPTPPAVYDPASPDPAARPAAAKRVQVDYPALRDKVLKLWTAKGRLPHEDTARDPDDEPVSQTAKPAAPRSESKR